jgi:hypothetical protein
MTLSLCLIAAGKTDDVEESHFGDVGHHRTNHSESGWTTTDTFCRWLSWLCGVYDDGQSLWLILDCYSVHRQEELKHYAAEHGINLLLIPPGLTDEFQARDHFTFGVMKSNSRWVYQVHVTEFGPMSKQVAAWFLVRA